MTATLIVGLGNPGAAHTWNRHNLGFQAVERIAERFSLSSWSLKLRTLASEGTIGEFCVTAIQPLTQMNYCGGSVGPWFDELKISAQDIIVFHDDIEVPFGEAWFYCGGTTGGHKGVRSIAARIGANFRRVRLGIGCPPKGVLSRNYVLDNFSNEERSRVNSILDELADFTPAILQSSHAEIWANSDERNIHQD